MSTCFDKTLQLISLASDAIVFEHIIFPCACFAFNVFFRARINFSDGLRLREYGVIVNKLSWNFPTAFLISEDLWMLTLFIISTTGGAWSAS